MFTDALLSGFRETAPAGETFLATEGGEVRIVWVSPCTGRKSGCVFKKWGLANLSEEATREEGKRNGVLTAEEVASWPIVAPGSTRPSR
jgi:hypothetical protein